MGFWPYFLHEYSSGGISAIFILIAGTLITLFTLDFLFFEQWHRSEDEPHLIAASSTELHFLLYDDDERGGFPEDCDRLVSCNPDESEGWIVLSVSPVRVDMNELAAEIDGDGEKLIVVPDSFLSTEPFLPNKLEALFTWWW